MLYFLKQEGGKMKNRYRHVLIVDNNAAIHEDFSFILDSDYVHKAAAEFDKELFGIERAPSSVFSPGYPIKVHHVYSEEDLDKITAEMSRKGETLSLVFSEDRLWNGPTCIEIVESIWKKWPHAEVVIQGNFLSLSPEIIREQIKRSEKLSFLRRPFKISEVKSLTSQKIEKSSLNE